jgi:NADH-quinone oxidoreductase subunit F
MRMTPQEIVGVIDESGERGRGGAAFPTAVMWRACAETAADEKYLVANGDEGDPGSFIDRVLMEHDPHSVIDGLLVAARATGARRGVVFIRSEYPQAMAAVRTAIEEARAAGILGATSSDTWPPFDLDVFPGMGSYVCGEETALLNAIEGFRGEVRLRPPFPTAHGLFGKPTVVNNIETLAAVPWIIEHGAAAFRRLGTAESTGSKAMCLNHGFARPGIVEVPFGTNLRELIVDHAGGGRGGTLLEAVVLGGPMGSILAPEQWDVPIDYEGMAARGIQLGHGGLVAVPAGTDWSAMLRHWLTFMAHESCGKCVPCRTGSSVALEYADRSDDDGRQMLARLLDVMADGSLCAFGKLMPGPMRTILARLTADTRRSGLR